MKTDKEFYQILQTKPDFFTDLTGLPLQGIYHFTSITWKSLEKRGDGALIPEDPQQPVYLIEFQAQLDHFIYDRLLWSMCQYRLEKENKDLKIHGVIIFHKAIHAPTPQAWQQGIQIFYLEDIWKNLPDEHILKALFLPLQAPENIHLYAKQAFEQINTSTLSFSHKAKLQEVFLSWLLQLFNQQSIQEVLNMLGISSDSIRQTRFYQEVFAEGEAKGIEQGLQQGIEQGIEQGETKLLTKLLIHRFGALPEWAEQYIKEATIEQLERWAEKVLDAKTLEDVFN